jgi:hypothetical protein
MLRQLCLLGSLTPALPLLVVVLVLVLSCCPSSAAQGVKRLPPPASLKQ